MLTNQKLVAVAYFTILAVGIHAQSPTSTAVPSASTPACVTACINSSLSPAGCPTVSDLQCLCTNQVFDQAATKCIQANCTPAERTEALQIQVQECSALNSTSSATATSAAASAKNSHSSAMDSLQFRSDSLAGIAISLVAVILPLY